MPKQQPILQIIDSALLGIIIYKRITPSHFQWNLRRGYCYMSIPQAVADSMRQRSLITAS